MACVQLLFVEREESEAKWSFLRNIAWKRAILGESENFLKNGWRIRGVRMKNGSTFVKSVFGQVERDGRGERIRAKPKFAKEVLKWERTQIKNWKAEAYPISLR